MIEPDAYFARLAKRHNFTRMNLMDDYPTIADETRQAWIDRQKPVTDTLDAIAREILLRLAAGMDDQAARWALESGDYAQGRVNSFAECAYEVRAELKKLTALSKQGDGAVVPQREPDAWFVSSGFEVELVRFRVQAEQLMESGAWSCYPMYIGPAPTAEADRRDAERYRWLRSNPNALVRTDDFEWYLDPSFSYNVPQSLDDEIDAAIAATQEQT